MRSTIAKLLSEHYSPAEVGRYSSFVPAQRDIDNLFSAADALLTMYRDVPEACVILNAVWAALLRDRMRYPAHVVLGDLFINDEHVYGKHMNKELYAATFATDTINLDWDGHCWLVFGDIVGDASLIRTGKSNLSHLALQSLVRTKLSNVRGVFATHHQHLSDAGLRYVPHYALSDGDITAVFQSSGFLSNA